MSYYTTKSSTVERDYVVIRHGFRGTNASIMGVRFRDGWAVVEKGSKVYFRIRQLPMLKNLQERPLSFLKELPFINRAADVKMIYGADVFAKYVALDTKIKEKEIVEKIELKEKLHVEDETLCKFRIETGTLCRHSVQDPKISSYCPLHILKDPRLKDIDFIVPLALTSKDRKKLRKRAFGKLKDVKPNEGSTDVSVVESDTPRAQEQNSKEA